MRKTLLALAIALVPAAGAAADPPAKTPPDVMDEALERMLDALRFVMRAIPQYEMPEVLPNGDILIRRVPPEPQRGPEDEPAPAPTPPSKTPDVDTTRT